MSTMTPDGKGAMSVMITPEEVPEVDPIRVVVTRLSRPHRSGGTVIERAAIMAEGTNSVAIIEWIAAHHGLPEAAVSGPPPRGLHGGRMTGGAGTEPRTPNRYVLPAGALG